MHAARVLREEQRFLSLKDDGRSPGEGGGRVRKGAKKPPAGVTRVGADFAKERERVQAGSELIVVPRPSRYLLLHFFTHLPPVLHLSRLLPLFPSLISSFFLGCLHCTAWHCADCRVPVFSLLGTFGSAALSYRGREFTLGLFCGY